MAPPVRVEALLKRIYFNPSHPASYGGVNALYLSAKKENKKVTRKQIENWLSAQDAYTLHRKVVNKFPRRKFLSRGLNNIFQADLVDMSKFSKDNDNVRYWLTVLDIFSRKAFVEKLKNKNSISVLHAFKKILSKNKAVPKKLHTDLGSEFMNRSFQNYLKSRNIIHYQTSQSTKAALVERLHRTLKNRLFRYMTAHKTHRYVPVLEQIVDSYNNRVHSAIGTSPSKVNKKNEKTIWNRQYGGYVRKEANVKYKFEINDSVRISKYRHAFSRGFSKSFRSEIFLVTDQLPTHPPTYILRDLSGVILKGCFYQQELVQVKSSWIVL
jgi:transposase InsO family protein